MLFACGCRSGEARGKEHLLALCPEGALLWRAIDAVPLGMDRRGRWAEYRRHFEVQDAGRPQAGKPRSMKEETMVATIAEVARIGSLHGDGAGDGNGGRKPAAGMVRLNPERLREARLRAGLTMQQLAGRCKHGGLIDYQRWEAGRGKMNTPAALVMAKVLGVSLDWLMEEAEVETRQEAVAPIAVEKQAEGNGQGAAGNGGAPRVLGETLRALRTAKGWTQGELAGMAGVTRTAITSIEGDRYPPSKALAYRLANILGVSVAALGEPVAAAEADAPPAAPLPEWLAGAPAYLGTAYRTCESLGIAITGDWASTEDKGRLKEAMGISRTSAGTYLSELARLKRERERERGSPEPVAVEPEVTEREHTGAAGVVPLNDNFLFLSANGDTGSTEQEAAPMCRRCGDPIGRTEDRHQTPSGVVCEACWSEHVGEARALADETLFTDPFTVAEQLRGAAHMIAQAAGYIDKLEAERAAAGGRLAEQERVFREETQAMVDMRSERLLAFGGKQA